MKIKKHKNGKINDMSWRRIGDESLTFIFIFNILRSAAFLRQLTLPREWKITEKIWKRKRRQKKNKTKQDYWERNGGFYFFISFFSLLRWFSLILFLLFLFSPFVVFCRFSSFILASPSFVSSVGRSGDEGRRWERTRERDGGKRGKIKINTKRTGKTRDRNMKI